MWWRRVSRHWGIGRGVYWYFVGGMGWWVFESTGIKGAFVLVSFVFEPAGMNCDVASMPKTVVKRGVLIWVG